MYRVWECVLGNCGHVNPNAGFDGGSHRRFWIWEPRCCVWESSPWTVDGDPRFRVFVGGSPWRLLTCYSRCRVCKGCHTGDCRYWTPGTESGLGGHSRYCGSVIPGAEYGKGRQTGDCGRMTQVQCPKRVSAWRLWMCEPGTGSGKGYQHGDCGCVNQIQGLGKGVSLEIVDM